MCRIRNYFATAPSTSRNKFANSEVVQRRRCSSTGPYILPVLLYGCETWTVTRTLEKRFNAWCLRKILRMPYTRHTITGCLPVSDRVKSFRLRLFGHLARSAPEEDHRVIAAALRPPTDWRRPVGRPRAIWLRTIDEDVQPLNFGVHTAWRKARDRDTWHQVVSTATLC